jgi:hypothetical protein
VEEVLQLQTEQETIETERAAQADDAQGVGRRQPASKAQGDSNNKPTASKSRPAASTLPHEDDDNDGNDDNDDNDDNESTHDALDAESPSNDESAGFDARGPWNFEGLVAGDSDDDNDADAALMQAELRAMLQGQAEDSDEPTAALPKDKKNKKRNRLGQRARQLLNEQKFGEAAKHVKNPKLDANKRHADQKEKARRTQQRQAKRDKAQQQQEAPLHPSWAAKLQAKAQPVQSYQGKRMVFDDEGAKPAPKRSHVQVSSVEESNLHPSWVAKQRQQQQSVQLDAFQGKKTTFSDED